MQKNRSEGRARHCDAPDFRLTWQTASQHPTWDDPAKLCIERRKGGNSFLRMKNSRLFAHTKRVERSISRTRSDTRTEADVRKELGFVLLSYSGLHLLRDPRFHCLFASFVAVAVLCPITNSAAAFSASSTALHTSAGTAGVSNAGARKAAAGDGSGSGAGGT